MSCLGPVEAPATADCFACRDRAVAKPFISVKKIIVEKKKRGRTNI